MLNHHATGPDAGSRGNLTGGDLRRGIEQVDVLLEGEQRQADSHRHAHQNGQHDHQAALAFG